MRERNMKDLDMRNLLDEYSDAAIKHAAASTEGDHKAANREYDRLAGVYRELKAGGDNAQNALLELLNHSNESVRGWAASHALEFAPSEGERVLTELMKAKSLWALDAEMTLKEWRNGTLRFR